MPGPHIPARAVVGDQVMAADVNAVGEFIQHIHSPDNAITGAITVLDILVAAHTGTGALVTGTPTADSSVVLACPGGDSAWLMELVGSNFATGGTVYFEGSADSTNGTNGNWAALSGRRGGLAETFLAYTATAAGIYRGNTAGLTYLRARMKGTSGNPSVTTTIRTSSGVGSTFLNASLPTGSNLIGHVHQARPATASKVTIYGEALTYVGTTEVIQSLVKNTEAANTTAGANNITPTAGKTLVLQSIYVTYVNPATAPSAAVTERIRGRYVISGSPAITSPIQAIDIRFPIPVTANASGTITRQFDMGGFPIPSGAVLGLSFLGSAAAPTNPPTFDVEIVGYEY